MARCFADPGRADPEEQQTSQKMVQEMMDTYMQLLSTPGTYLAGQTDQQHQTVQQSAQQLMEQVHQQQQTFQQQAQQQQEAFQEMTRQVLNTYTQLFNIRHSLTPRKVCAPPAFPSRAMTS